MTSLGQKIRSVRMERKMTQIALCKGLVSSSMISQIEADKATPSAQLLEQLAARLGVKPSYFADDMTQKTDLAQTYRRAKSYLEAGQFSAALPILEALIHPPSPQFREEVLYTDLAQCYERLDRHLDAAGMYEQIVRVSLEKDDVPSAVHAYYYLGQIYRKLNQPRLSRMFWQRAADLLSRHPDVQMPLAMKIHANLGRTYFLLESYPRSLTNYRIASILADRYSAMLDLAIIRHGMANVHMELHQYTEAEPLFHSALHLYNAVRHQRGVNQCKINIGVNLRRSGRLAEALAHLDTCIQDPDILTDVIRLANAFGERARCYLDMGRHDLAVRDGLRALETDSQTQDLLASVHCTLARAYLNLRETGPARDHAEQACDVANRLQKPVFVTQTLNLQREVYAAMGEHDMALSLSLTMASQALAEAVRA